MLLQPRSLRSYLLPAQLFGTAIGVDHLDRAAPHKEHCAVVVAFGGVSISKPLTAPCKRKALPHVHSTPRSPVLCPAGMWKT